MSASVRNRVCATVAIATLAFSFAHAQLQDIGRLTGKVTDASGGALPGVTVTLSSTRQPQTRATVTDGTGRYLFADLQPDVYAVSFELAGFETRTTPAVTIEAGRLQMLDGQLGLASLEEKVEVVADAPAPPPTPVEPLPPLRTRPEPRPVAPAVLASVCGPGQPGDPSLTIGHISAHRDDPKRELYNAGDILLLDVGGDRVSEGQNLVVRRRFQVNDKGLPAKQALFGEQTAGLIQVVDTSAPSAVAVVVYACGELFAGDLVEPFDAQPVVTVQQAGRPQFEDPARIIIGEHGQTMAGPRQLMVIDWGAVHGVQRGQRFSIFRRPQGDRGPISTIADGIIIAVRSDSATIRIDRANDAVFVGDMVALHR